jgi:hypothetical protein
VKEKYGNISNRWANVLCLFALAVATITLLSCKPIAYYLEKVYKAYGTVTDAVTGAPLESVEVVLGTYQYSELTNGLGDYELELAEGTWTIHFVKDGYVTMDAVVTVNATTPRVKVSAQLSRAGYQMSGTWESPSGITVPNGVYGYVKLVADSGQPTDPAVYWTRSSAFSGGTARYAISGIAAGTYTVWAFIDMNANAPNNAASMPDAADYFLREGRQVSVSADLVLNLDSSDWATAAGPEASWTYVGTWANTSYDSGGPAPKLVFTATLLELYSNTGAGTPVLTFDFTKTGDWTSGGAHYFAIALATPIPVSQGPISFILMRVSNSNMTLEINGSGTLPTEIDVNDSSYGIWTRQ